MSKACMVGGLLLLIATAVQADPGSEAVITESVVEVRSGPSFSQDFYATSRLYRGEKVHVLHQQTPTWLAIAPPTGSFSWVNARDVIVQNPRTAIVAVDGCKLRIGSALVNRPPEIARDVAKGTALTVIPDVSQTSGSDTWIAVLPAPNEERFIPTSAVKSGAIVQQTVAPPTVAVPNSFTSTAAASPEAELETLKTRAEKADLAGNLSEAIVLYEQLAEKTTETEARIRYLNRSQFLRDSQRTALVSRPPAPVQATLASNIRPAGTPAYVTAQPTGYYVPQRPATSQYCYVPEPCNSVRLAGPIMASASPPLYAAAPQPAVTTARSPDASAAWKPAAGPQAQWYGPGNLRRAAFLMDGRPAFALEADDGRVYAYVTAGGSLDLEPYVNHIVQLYGPVTYHGMMRTNYLTALQASTVR
jgi:hypothetical protein